MRAIVRSVYRISPVVSILFGVIGCGEASHGDVVGKVSYQGRPVVWGRVTLIASDHMPYRTTIGLDGSFSIPNVPCGPIQIGVDSLDPDFVAQLKPDEQADLDEFRRKAGVVLPPKPPKGAWFPIPLKYENPTTSPLTGEVGPGRVNLDLFLN